MTNHFPIRLILDQLRSSNNVGAILRTADAAGVERVDVCGYTPYPRQVQDNRPPHVIARNTRTIAKTALGAETTVNIAHFDTTSEAVAEARPDGFSIIVIEQSENSLNLYQYVPSGPIALIVGNEVDGVSPQIIAAAHQVLELPMLGRKESLNVATTAGIALYQRRFGAQ